jgi:Ca-activated chloride channel family protein
VGFTLLGVGQDYGGELAREISQIRGGNAFYLSSAARVQQLFEEEFDYFVTPAAYDLKLQITVPSWAGIRDVYGVPGYTPGQWGAVVNIPTLFFSPRENGGAIVVRLTFATPPTFDAPVIVGSASMQYTLRDGTFRQAGQELLLPAGLSPTAETPWFSEPTARRAALLLDTALVLRAAAQAGRDGRYADGARMIRGFLAQFDQATLGMNDRLDTTDRGLSEERRVLERLLGTLD